MTMDLMPHCHPEEETQGSIYFEIPQGSSQIELEYKISYFSDNKIIFKAK